MAHAYDGELLVRLRQRFGYRGTAADALAYFPALPKAQQGVFARQVYFRELLLGGREYNDPASTRYGSYLRGREAIATLFPAMDARGKAIAYRGDITMFSSITGSATVNGQTVPVITDAGIHTNFGGDIQLLNGWPDAGRRGGRVGGSRRRPDHARLGRHRPVFEGQHPAGPVARHDHLRRQHPGLVVGWRHQRRPGLQDHGGVHHAKRVYDALGNVTVSPNVPSSARASPR